MSGLDWRRAKNAGKRTLSEFDDRERRGRDAASRWLKRIESWKPPHHGRRGSKRKGASS